MATCGTPPPTSPPGSPNTRATLGAAAGDTANKSTTQHLTLPSSRVELEKYAAILRNKLDARDTEIASLRKRLQDLAIVNEPQVATNTTDGVPNSGATGGTQSVVVSLSKKIRSLNVMLARERREKANAIAEAEALRPQQQQPEAKQNSGVIDETGELSGETGNKTEDALAAAVAESGKLREKYVSTCKRLGEARAALVCVRAENSRWQKIVALETGEDATTVQRLASTDAWRGRSQQIALLRAKLKSANDQVAELLAANSGDLQNTAAARNALRMELEELRTASASKIDAAESRAAEAVARCASLDTRLRDLQRKLQAVVQKASNDDKYIKVLHAELANARETAIPIRLSATQQRTAIKGTEASIPLGFVADHAVRESSATTGVRFAAPAGAASHGVTENLGSPRPVALGTHYMAAAAAAAAATSSSAGQGSGAAHIMPASERECYEVEIKNLSERLDVYIDEVDAAKMTLQNAIDFIKGTDVSCYAKIIDVRSMSNNRSSVNNRRG